MNYPHMRNCICPEAKVKKYNHVFYYSGIILIFLAQQVNLSLEKGFLNLSRHTKKTKNL